MKYLCILLTGLFLIILLQLSCSSSHRHHDLNSDTSFVAGKVTDGIKCSFDVTQSFALYLPSHYDKSKKWPVVYMFDPHGKGSLPVTKYSAIAENFGYILIGSNNSKNGLPFNSIKVMFDTLYADTHRKFSIDDNAVYAAGFSGGSRVASSLATDGKIKSVIACGAGMSNSDVNSINKFGYFGIVGNEDFNYTEMLAIRDYLDNNKGDHCFIVFDGKHEWPADSLMQQAFLWTDLRAMKNKTKEWDLSIAEPYFSSWGAEFKKIKASEPYAAFVLCDKIIRFFSDIKDVSYYKTAYADLMQNKTVLAAIEKQKSIAEKESQLQTEYASAISTQDTSWWKQQITVFNAQINNAAERSMAQMYKRVLNYLSLAAYSNANAAIKSGNYATAEKYVKIYSLVDPENPEHAYMKTILLLKKNNISGAMTSLENAAALGFGETERLETDTVMGRLRNQEAYPKILEIIKTNATKEK